MSTSGPSRRTDSAVRHLSTVARGSAVGLAGAIVAGLGGFALAIVISRLLPRSEAGTFFTVTSLFLLAEATCVLGADTGLGRFALRLERHGSPGDRLSLLRTAFTPPVVLSVGVGAGLVVVAPQIIEVLRIDPSATVAVRLLGAALPVAVTFQLCLAGTRAYGAMRPTAVTDNLVRTGGQPLSVLLVGYLGAGLTGLVAGWLVPYAAAAVLAVVLLRSTLAARSEPAGGSSGRKGLPRAFWGFTAPRAVARISQIGLQRADVLIVASLRGPSEAAVYTVATRFVPLGQLATQALQQVLQPRFTALLAADDHATVKEVYRVATGWNTLLAWPIYLIAATVPAAYLGLFGAGYAADGATVVVVLALAMLVAVAAGPADTLLLMAGRSTWSLFNSLVALVVDVGLCFWLVPEFGIVAAGAAWAVAVVLRNVLGLAQVGILLDVGGLGRPFLYAAFIALSSVAAPVVALSLVIDVGALALLAAAPFCLLVFGALSYRWRRILAIDVLVAGIRAKGRPDK